MIQTFAWTPWLIWSLDKFFNSRSWRYAALTGMFLGLHLLGGFPFYTYLVGWALLSYGFYLTARLKLWNQYKIISIRLGLGLLLGVGIFLTQASLTHELLQNSTRDKSNISFTASYSLNSENIATLIVPHYFGGNIEKLSDKRSYFGSTFIWENSAYMGISSLILAVTACVCCRRSQTKFWLNTFIVFFIISLGTATPLFNFLYKWLPGFSLFRGYSKALTISVFAFAILSGIGFDKVIENPKNYCLKYGASGLFIILFSCWILGSISPDLLPFWQKSLTLKFNDWGISPNPELHELYLSNLKKSLMTSALIVLVTLAFIIIYFARRLSSNIFGYALITIIAGDFYLFSTPYMKGMSFKNYSISEDFFTPLGSFSYPGRIFWSDSMLANLSLPHRVFSSGGYENFPLREYSKMINYLNNSQLNSKNTYLKVNPSNLSIKLLGGNFIVFKSILQMPPGFKQLSQTTIANSIQNLYQTPINWPRYHIVHNSRPFDGEQTPEQYRKLAQEIIKETYNVIYISPHDYSANKSLGIKTPKNRELDSVQLSEERPGFSKLKVHMSTPGFLVLNENFYPGWHARVDGVEEKVFPANLIMKAVSIPSGNHEVEFYFFPNYFYLLASVSLISFVVLVVLIMIKPASISRLDEVHIV
tara:strand:+ start:59 stop:1999 length:1941 start_codon:yes stop_codon:yes gene_type:complete